jgi:hypothetical protein
MAKETGKAVGKVVAASMSAGSTATIGSGLGSSAIEDAMSQATLDALANGITDPDKILKLKMAARERVKREHAEAVKKAAKDSAG